MHRVGRDEADRAAARAAERLQQLLQDLVGTIGGPEVFDAKLGTGLRGEVGGQVACAAPPRRGRGSGAGRRRPPAPTARRRRPAPGWAGAGSRWCSAAPERPIAVRRRAICRAGRRAAAGRRAWARCRHRSNLRRTASPCAGRSSALASVITCPDDVFERRLGVVDDVDAAQEGLHRQAAGVPGTARGGQHVVGPGAVVAEAYRRVRTDENRSGRTDLAGHPRRRRRFGSPGVRRRRR